MHSVTRRSMLAATAAAAATATIAPAFADDAPQAAPGQTVAPDLSWLGQAPEVDEAAVVQELSCKLVIVGAGNAGMVAAARAAELGLDFILVEKKPVVSDARDFVGAVNDKTIIEAGCTEDRFQLLRELVRYSSGKANSQLLMNWIDNSGAFMDWLGGVMDGYGFDTVLNTDNGIEEVPQYYCPVIEHNFAAREGSEYAEFNRHGVLLDYIQQKGYEPLFNESLYVIERNPEGVVTGVVVQSTEDGSLTRINAEAVLLATGGYADNPDMMAAIQPAQSKTLAAWMVYPGDDGYGIKAGMWVGADKDWEPTAMLFDRGVLLPGQNPGMFRDENGNWAVPNGYMTTLDEYNPATQPFLKVNRRGERFCNEAGPYTDVIYAAQNQPGNAYAQIFDASFAEDWEAFHTLGCSSLSRKLPFLMVPMVEGLSEAGVIQKADTLEELAEKLGLEGEAVETFLATVDRYNELYDMGADEDFGKVAFRLSEVREAPFYGVWLAANLLCTSDGLRISRECQVLDVNHDPIPGLYAAGDCSGSFFANNYPYLFPGICVGHGMWEAWTVVNEVAGA